MHNHSHKFSGKFYLRKTVAPDKLEIELILNCLESRGGGGKGVLLGILGRGVPPASSNLDPILYQKV